MSDDLIKRLGDPNRDWPEFGHDRREAKNLIEQLERERKGLEKLSIKLVNEKLHGEWREPLEDAKDEAEAKLAKAMAALQFCAALKSDFARAVLAELEGM